jgi:serine/threonine protein phosphatase 1
LSESPAGVPDPNLPSGRLLCIGDIHGCAHELEILLDAVAPGPSDRLVFLGDYIDRGADSAGVVERIISLRAELPATICLRGNHEEMLLGFLGLDGSRPEIFVGAGGAATLKSYGLPAAQWTPEGLRRVLPESHLEFFSEALQYIFTEGPFVFVHAGIRAGVPLDQQVREDLLWIREDFLSCEHGLMQTVIFGHTPQRRVLFTPRRRIAMDSGCVYGGYLSCLDLTGGVIHEVRRRADSAVARRVESDLRVAGVPADWAARYRAPA